MSKTVFQKAAKMLGGIGTTYVAANLAFGGIEAWRTANEPCGSFTYPLNAWVSNSLFAPNENGVQNRLGLVPLGFVMMGSMIGDGIGEAIREPRCIERGKGPARESTSGANSSFPRPG